MNGEANEQTDFLSQDFEQMFVLWELWLEDHGYDPADFEPGKPAIAVIDTERDELAELLAVKNEEDLPALLQRKREAAADGSEVKVAQIAQLDPMVVVIYS